MIPLLDLVAQYHGIQSEIDAAVRSVLESGHFIIGPNVKAFEEEAAHYLGVGYSVGVASGTDALVIALRALDIGPGDEVIIPAYTFFATAGAVLTVGAHPVFVDVDPHTYLIDIEQVARHLTTRTKAMIPVHLYGHPVDMAPVMELARENRLKVIEDNAQAFGATYQGHKTGSLGDIGCLSFFPTKNLGAYGDGGMVVTNNSTLAERMRMLRTHGWKKKYHPEMLGYNSRLDELQAAILRVKLPHVDAWNARRREIAAIYTARLSALGVPTPVELLGSQHVYHLYIIRLKNRDQVQAALKAVGIASEVYYPQPPHLADPCRALGYQPGDCPVAEQASQETLALPLYPEMTEAQVNAVVEALAGAVYS
ncbi:MAG: DegT/DnrJ/EryC1/StrS family aminotransferase [Anaerolineales bacterium]|nr:DegT/DnrJ/EryC1/StrS family aminotransferase [Anaerolineales bacterium]